MGNVVIRLTVSDSKGASVTDSRAITLGTMAGMWSFTTTDCGNPPRDVPAVMTLAQTGGTVTGSVSWPGSWCNVKSTSGMLHPNAPGTIDDQGNFMAPRITASGFQEFNLKGKMDSTGRTTRVRRQIQGSEGRSPCANNSVCTFLVHVQNGTARSF